MNKADYSSPFVSASLRGLFAQSQLHKLSLGQHRSNVQLLLVEIYARFGKHTSKYPRLSGSYSTVEPPLREEYNLSTKALMCPFSIASKRRTTSLQGTECLVPMCPLFRGSTVHAVIVEMMALKGWYIQCYRLF